jgi:hypothetical protein
MIAKSVGADPKGRLTQAAGAGAWRALRVKAGINAAVAARVSAA